MSTKSPTSNDSRPPSPASSQSDQSPSRIGSELSSIASLAQPSASDIDRILREAQVSRETYAKKVSELAELQTRLERELGPLPGAAEGGAAGLGAAPGVARVRGLAGLQLRAFRAAMRDTISTRAWKLICLFLAMMNMSASHYLWYRTYAQDQDAAPKRLAASGSTSRVDTIDAQLRGLQQRVFGALKQLEQEDAAMPATTLADAVARAAYLQDLRTNIEQVFASPTATPSPAEADLRTRRAAAIAEARATLHATLS